MYVYFAISKIRAILNPSFYTFRMSFKKRKLWDDGDML